MYTFFPTDGSIALHCIAKIVDSRVMYINGEGNSSTWPGKFYSHFQ